MSTPTTTEDLDALLADGNNSPQERAAIEALLRATLQAIAAEQARERRWPMASREAGTSEESSR